ncbi:MAG: hypothetical protein ACRCWR_08645 [Saezia sp.]
MTKRLVLSARRFATDSTTSTAKQTDNAIKLKSLDYKWWLVMIELP